jgi:hypothetical protein
LRSSGVRYRSGEGGVSACSFDFFVVAVDSACFLLGWARERWAPFVRAMLAVLNVVVLGGVLGIALT